MEPFKVEQHDYQVLFPECSQRIIKSSTPSGAAKKVYSKIIRPLFVSDEDKLKKYTVTLINKKSNKTFEYEVYEIEKHDYVIRGNKQILYGYNVVVKSKNIKQPKQNSVRRTRTNMLSPPKSNHNSPAKKTFFIKRTPTGINQTPPYPLPVT